jgi:putative glutamine amidotransferase
MNKVTIGVTDCSKYDNYANWISQSSIVSRSLPSIVSRLGDDTHSRASSLKQETMQESIVETIKLGYRLNNLNDIKKCHGILLTGGEDVHPRFYNKLEYLELCYQDDIDEKRDEFEIKVLEFTQHNKIPVLGICRGLQIANVFFGGTLIPDIPTFGKFNHSKRAGNDTYHTINIDANGGLYKLIGGVSGEVNSAHHQSADRVGNGLVTNAFSIDGVIEGLEWSDPSSKPYLGLVQWHPERMRDQANSLTAKIKENFLDQIASNK